MTSHFDSASGIVYVLNKEKEKDLNKFLVGGLALMSALDDLIQHFKTCGKPIIEKHTRMMFGRHFDEDEKAYLETLEEDLLWEFYKIARQIAEAGHEKNKYAMKFVKGARLELLGMFLSDAHDHDHTKECHLKMIRGNTCAMFDIFRGLCSRST